MTKSCLIERTISHNKPNTHTYRNNIDQSIYLSIHKMSCTLSVIGRKDSRRKGNCDGIDSFWLAMLDSKIWFVFVVDPGGSA